MRKSFKVSDARTIRQIAEERRQSMIDNNIEKFGKVSIGVHGFELPKFR